MREKGSEKGAFWEHRPSILGAIWGHFRSIFHQKVDTKSMLKSVESTADGRRKT